jgi:hypothetical protein
VKSFQRSPISTRQCLDGDNLGGEGDRTGIILHRVNRFTVGDKPMRVEIKAFRKNEKTAFYWREGRRLHSPLTWAQASLQEILADVTGEYTEASELLAAKIVKVEILFHPE